MSANLNQCPRCSAVVQPGTRFCPNCGNDLAAASPVAPAAGPAPVPAVAPISEQAKQRIMEAISRRGQTDEVIPTWWAFLPIVAILVSMVFTFAGFYINIPGGFIVTIAVSLIVAIVVLILIYKLLKRHNLHLAREANLRRAIIDFFASKATEKGTGPQVLPYTQAMEGIDREGLGSEKPQDAMLWTILCIIPFINYVAYILIAYWLTSFSPGHDRRFFAFAQNAQYAGAQMGMANLLPPTWRAVPDRSFLLYFVLTIVTFGLFAIYWAYVLIKDLNEHFQNEWEFEDALVRELPKV